MSIVPNATRKQRADRLIRQRWIDALPRCDKNKINPKSFRLCEKHWPDNVCLKTISRRVHTISRSNEKFVCIFMSDDYSECDRSIIVYNKGTLTSPLTVKCVRKGIPLSALIFILNKNNGLSTYSQFSLKLLTV